MDFSDPGTLYELLNLSPGASPTEIRDAYQRAKATFQKDSPALYSLMDAEDGAEMLEKIERAYEVLADPRKRREYDRRFGPASPKVVSIDRRPPMESGQDDSILVSPRTEFKHPHPISSPGGATGTTPDPAIREMPAAFRAGTTSDPEPVRPADLASAERPRSINVLPAAAFTPSPVAPITPQAPRASASPSKATSDLELAILNETEWSGAFLRRVREARRLAPEDIMTATRITRVYLSAIEEECFAKLPAPVYIRGFIMQIAKILRLPAEQVTATYLERYRKALPHKFQ